MFVHLVFAKFFPKALPPTVIEATSALIINWMSKLNPMLCVIFTVSMALIAPLSTPHISPITSLHILETFGADLINFMAVFAPYTTPTKITTISTINAGNVAKPFILVVDMYENVIDNINVTINIVKNHLTASFFGFLFFSFFFFISLYRIMYILCKFLIVFS